MPKQQTIRFTVQGRGPFPLDMLRYDRCFPRTEVDANTAQHGQDAREVTVLACARPVYWHPTVGRWQSFGWNVVKVERVEE